MPIVDPFAAPAAPKPLRIVDPFAKQPQPEPEPTSIWTDAADFSKRLLGSVIGGTAGAPLGAEQAVKGAARSAMEGTPEAIMPASVYQPGLDTEETLFGPESKEERARRKLSAQRAVAEIPNLPGARSLNEFGKEVQKTIEDSVSEKTKKAIRESTPTGNIFKGELSLGENPTIRGYAMQGASVFGSLLPVVVTAIATKSPTAAGGVGGAMAAEEAATSAAEYINKLPHKKLMEASPFYASLIEGGASEKEARELATRKAAETGAVLQGMVAALGDRFTGKLVTGAFDNLLRKAAGKSILARTAAGAALSAGEEAIQEVAEGVAADIGLQNVIQSKEIGEDSAANLILGAIGGSAPGGYRGLRGAIRDRLIGPAQGAPAPGRTVLDMLSEDGDVTGFDTTAGGAGAGVAGATGPAAGAPTPQGPQLAGVAPAPAVTGGPAGGATTQPTAVSNTIFNGMSDERVANIAATPSYTDDLRQAAIEELARRSASTAPVPQTLEEMFAGISDERVAKIAADSNYLDETRQAATQELQRRQTAAAAPAPSITPDFRQQYNDLRGELLGLMSLSSPTQADLNQMRLVKKDLDALIDSNADAINAASGDPRLTQAPSKKFALTLKNPMFNGDQLLGDIEATGAVGAPGQARAAQGELFGPKVMDLTNQALAAARQNPEQAVSYLQAMVQRTKERMPIISADGDWGRRMAPMVGMTAREGLQNPAKVAELFAAQQEKKVADAIATIQGQGKARGMAGFLFGEQATANDLLKQALTANRDDPARAIQQLQTLQKRAQDQLPELSKDSEWGRKTARSVGMTEQQGAADPAKVARLFTAQRSKAISEAIDAARGLEAQGEMFGAESEDKATQERTRAAELSRAIEKQTKKEATPSAPTGVTPELFNSAVAKLEALFEPKKPAAPTEEFGAPVEEEAPAPTAEQTQAEAEQEQRRREAKELVRAPEVSTERVLETPAGQMIKRFFDLIQPANRSQSELSKHQASKNAAANTLLEYDIARPGQKDLPGLMKALDYLVQKVGGKDKFAALLESLDGASPSEQANLLRRAGLPDLTSRRGIDSFRDTVQREVQEMTVRGEGVRLPTRSTPSKITGTPIPYREEINTGVSEYVFREPEQGTGKPRRPTMRQLARQFVISDTKVRTAARILRDLIDTGSKMSDPAQAAATYFSNPVRSTFGEALNDLAFDLAMREIEPDNYGAGSTFPGEGGKYALQFQEWIKTNLDQNTVELLNELVEMHSKTARENAKYEVAVSNYKQAEREYAEQQRQKAEKTSGVKLPKAPKRVSERVPETEAGEQEAEPEAPKVPAKNLPRRQGLYEVHPAIKRALEKGDTRKALELISQAKGNPYYALLADRLLAANITAKTTFIDQDTLQALNEPNNDTFNNYIDTLSEMVVEMYPVDQQAGLVTLLKSGRLRDVTAALAEMRATLTTTKATDGQIKVFNEAVTYFNQQYGWIAKYDPNTDTLVFRQGTGLTNATFLHEVLHAATSAYLDNPNALTGVQRQGYDQLMELYNYSKGALSQNGFAVDHIYGLNDIHEFVSEALTNPEFQAQLRALRYKASPFSLANWFTEGIRKLFNIKKGYESNVLNEIIFASDAMMLGTTAGKEKLTGTTGAKAAPGPTVTPIPQGRPNIPGANKAMFNALLKPKNWNQVRPLWPVFYANLKSNVRPGYLGGLTLDQIADLVDKRLPQFAKFARTVENFLARKNSILTEAADISKRWEQLQARDAGMSAKLADVMSAATIREFDPDPLVPSTAAERAKNADVLNMWRGLNPEARAIYREVRDFYEQRYSEYRRTLNRRLMSMAQYGVSTQTINDIRAEFDKAKRKGPYFPLMRHGSLAYQIGSGRNREYYMFESLGEMELHMQQRLAADPHLRSTIQPFYDYKEAMDAHARESNFLRGTFDAIESANFGAATPQEEAAHKQALKDNVYQTWLTNQPESSFRNRFIHRSNVAGYSQDALRNFASSSFHMAYQLSRFEYSQDMFSQLQAAKQQIKARVDPANPADPVVMRENKELSDYVKDADRRLDLILNPTDVGTIPSTLTNIGFIWYMTSFASAAFNVVGGMAIALPTLVGQNVRENANKSYSRATLEALGQMKTVFGQIMMSGFDYETGPRIRDFALKSPSLQRAQDRYVTVGGRTFQVASGLSRVDQAAYNRFVADGLIDITGTYDMSGLAATPTEDYSGARNKTMQVLSYLFHNAERLNREIVAMSAFRLAMEKRAGMANRQQAFAESIAEAKATTNASMFNYSSTNKPRWFQHPAARVVLQFKQFPQQMTWFLSRSLWKSFAAADPAIRREARARFVGTMGMTAIFSGATGLWGFSTVAAIVNACAALFGGDDEEPFDFELEFKNWVGETFGKNLGTAISSGVFNAAGIDVASRVKLDDMWFRDGRKNQDEVDAVTTAMVDMMGPVPGLVPLVARAVQLWNEGHPNRALETIAPAFIKQPMIAYRYAKEGVNTLDGDPLMEDMGPFLLMMQSLGIRSAELAERQYYNITKKGQAEEIRKKRTNLLNGFAITFMSNDAEGIDKALDKIMEFNDKYPSVRIPMKSISRSIRERLEKSAQTDHGLFIDPRLRDVLLNERYMDDED